ncbi:peptidoglycan-recognition protein SA-like [Macrosteles quadrilineatus]|uniref:peptidoglycan-recognition protein SA-like n=1 Tax=Macrosteles quadrilineatus TaxID=74068 RepID=UPI0023E1E2EF|nr:peptidoglycan-recognition protein SA-like [Macrosteles quadrilineatus]
MEREPATVNIAENFPDFMIPGVQRIGWGACAPLWKHSLRIPVTHVRFTHTGTQACRDKRSCSFILQTMQKFYISQANLGDIPYNFMIGEDGLVYKGRGWFSEPARPPNLKYLSWKCLDIAFIGNFTDKKPSPEAESRAADLISFGVASRKIQHDYTLIKLGETPLVH